VLEEEGDARDEENEVLELLATPGDVSAEVAAEVAADVSAEVGADVGADVGTAVELMLDDTAGADVAAMVGDEVAIGALEVED